MEEKRQQISDDFDEKIEKIREILSKNYDEKYKRSWIITQPLWQLQKILGAMQPARKLVRMSLKVSQKSFQSLLMQLRKGKIVFYLSPNFGENKVFIINWGEIVGRVNPNYYKKEYRDLKKIIKCSNYSLGETEIDEDLTSCLTIRATEFDNKYNLGLDNSRTKYRKYKPHVYEKIALSSNDILIEKSGGSDAQPVGRVAFIEKDMIENRSLACSNFIH